MSWLNIVAIPASDITYDLFSNQTINDGAVLPRDIFFINNTWKDSSAFSIDVWKSDLIDKPYCDLNRTFVSMETTWIRCDRFQKSIGLEEELSVQLPQLRQIKNVESSLLSSKRLQPVRIFEDDLMYYDV